MVKAHTVGRQWGWLWVMLAAVVLVIPAGTGAQAEPGVAVEIRVKEFLRANPPLSAWVDSNTVVLPFGKEVYGLQGNFGVNLLATPIDSESVSLQYRLATIGSNVQQRSAIVDVEYGVPVIIDSIPGKGKSYYRALLTPRLTEVERTCGEAVGEPESWPSDPSAYFDFYYIRNSLADAHWNILRDFLEGEYKIVHKVFDLDFPGKIYFYFCPCSIEDLDFERGFGMAIDPARMAGYAVYHKGTNSIDPQITNLLKFYRWWGFAPRFLVWGVSGFTDFSDYYARKYLDENKLVSFDKLLVSGDFRSVDPLVAYFESASFIHFLIDSIGVNSFHELYEKSTDLSIKPAFLSVTGRTIKQWEQMWRNYIAAREFHYPELVFHAHRAQAILRQSEHIEYLERAIADMQDTVSLSLTQELAAAYYSVGRYGDAYIWYKNMVDIEPDNAQFRQYCGNIAAVLGWLDEAWGYFEEAIRLDSTFSAPFLSMGEIMELRGHPDSAVALWNTGLNRGESIPLYTELSIRLARYDRRQFRRDESMDRLELARNATSRLLDQYPDHPRYLLRMGDILTEMLQPDSALMYYESAEFFEERPFFLASIYLGTGKAYDLAGDRKKAVEYYEKVFDVDAGYGTQRYAEKYLNQIYK